MHSSQNQNPHRGRPVKRAQPPFSQHTIREIILTIILASLIFTPARQFSPRLAQGTGPTYSVAIVDYNFLPPHINITTGTTVVWTYASNGKDFHTVTSDPGTNQTQGGAPLLNSGSLSPGQSFSYTFNQPSYYPYQCSFHPLFMKGWVNVTGAPVTPPTPQSPAPQNPGPNFLLITLVAGVVAAVILAATVALFVRRKQRTSIASASTQNTTL